ncbi:MAG: hypothetical protein JXA11_00875 [Phycisphaerae bacterium]|nr:hypothetical protein [Phycisphaerae bacterium]
MALKVRCSQCQKKISVDEAFAGSMCRCPYCKMIVQVPELALAAEGVARPSRPVGRPERPDSPRPKTVVGSGLKHTTGSRPIVGAPGTPRPARPAGPTVIEKPGVPKVPHKPGRPVPAHRPDRAGARTELIESAPVDESRLTPEQIAAIPTANPVFLQGIVSLILIGILVVVGGASVYLGVRVFSGPSSDDDNAAYLPDQAPAADEELPNPFLVGQGGPKVCQNVSIAIPVVYLIDGGDSMGDLYLYCRDAVRASVLSLGAGGTFGVVLAGEEHPLYIGKKIFSGGESGEKILRPLLQSNFDEDPENAPVEIGGASDLNAAVETALSLKPKTLVLFVRNTDLSDPKILGERIASAKARLILVVMGYEYDEQKEQYEALVQAAGDDAKLMLYDADHLLRSYYDQRNLPE